MENLFTFWECATYHSKNIGAREYIFLNNETILVAILAKLDMPLVLASAKDPTK